MYTSKAVTGMQLPTEPHLFGGLRREGLTRCGPTIIMAGSLPLGAFKKWEEVELMIPITVCADIEVIDSVLEGYKQKRFAGGESHLYSRPSLQCL